MYPDDEYCDYLFYTNVIASNGSIQVAKDPVSWDVFQRRSPKYKRTQLGISFDFENVTPYGVDAASGDLDSLREQGIRHYGLLTVLSYQKDFQDTLRSTKGVLEKLKKIQGEDRTAMVALAIGCYDFGRIYRTNIKQGFTDAVNYFKADIVILMGSQGWVGPQGACIAAPPNAITSPELRYFDLGYYWYAVSLGSTFLKPLIITGLSFEMSALQYVMKNKIKSLNESLYKPCLSVKRQRQALCAQTSDSGSTTVYLGSPMFTYGIISNSSKVLTMGELNDTLALKFAYATRTFGELRARTAWLLYNVHNLGIGNQCGDRPFYVIRQFCYFLKGSSNVGCQGSNFFIN
ncbi:uncharacterized protein LOC142769264 [Rhipicephalus microplus]|uniref:uncharacterized protein LOC142769264 n=1 Tax=Rhipicephalus microplus TaxID=6941 RepID=UPI003F6AC7CB